MNSNPVPAKNNKKKQVSNDGGPWKHRQEAMMHGKQRGAVGNMLDAY